MTKEIVKLLHHVYLRHLCHIPHQVLHQFHLYTTDHFPFPMLYHSPQMPSSSSGGGNSQTAYPDKIRAVIYPSQQRNWNTSASTNQEASQQQDSTTYASSTFPGPGHSASDTPVLQRLANGKRGLFRGIRVGTAHTLGPGISGPQPVTKYRLYRPRILMCYQRIHHQQPALVSTSEAISSQSLRPSPIQDLPEERPVTTTPSSTDGQRRPEVLSRANYNQSSSAQVPPSAAQSPLASIATSSMTTNSMSAKRETVEGTSQPVISKEAQKGKEDLAALLQTALQAQVEDRFAEKEAEAPTAQGYTR